MPSTTEKIANKVTQVVKQVVKDQGIRLPTKADIVVQPNVFRSYKSGTAIDVGLKVKIKFGGR